MKKILAMLLCIFLLAGLSTGVLADEAEMVPALAQVPSDWEGVCCWAWADDGTNAFSAWPGGAMEPLGESGWLYIYVPSFVQNVILNANEATVQTAGDVVEAGKAVWISVTDDLTTTVSYDAQVDVEIPAYVETYTVHAYIPLEWETVAVQGTAMTGGENGWFTAQVPVTETSLVLSGNDGAAETEAIAVEPQEVWITVYNDLTTEVVYEDPEAPQAEPITVYAQVADDWAAPCRWAWSAPDGTNAFSAWPGEAMTQGEDGWYALEVPGWVNSIITIFTTFKQFDVVYLLTQQMGARTGSGFHTILTYAYENAFVTNNYGYSSAISIIIFLLMLAFSARFQLREEGDA